MSERPNPLGPPTRLTVLTDSECSLCRQCRAWLSSQYLLVPIEFLSVGSPEAVARYQSAGNQRNVLIVADEYGRLWMGPDAFVMCLWATDRYRTWAHWAARPGWRVIARHLFKSVSSNRHRISHMMSGTCSDETCTTHGPKPAPRPPAPPQAPPPPLPTMPPPDGPPLPSPTDPSARVVLGLR